jgi:hypothetical protein
MRMMVAEGTYSLMWALNHGDMVLLTFLKFYFLFRYLWADKFTHKSKWGSCSELSGSDLETIVICTILVLWPKWALAVYKSDIYDLWPLENRIIGSSATEALCWASPMQRFIISEWQQAKWPIARKLKNKLRKFMSFSARLL